MMDDERSRKGCGNRVFGSRFQSIQNLWKEIGGMILLNGSSYSTRRMFCYVPWTSD